MTGRDGAAHYIFGMSIAVLINAHSRRGSDGLGARIRTLLPDAAVRVTRSLEEAHAWIRDELVRTKPRIFLSGGGDGTAVSVLDMLREHDLAVEAVGLLPFGTGNAWARSTGEMNMGEVLRGVSALRGSSGRGETLPVRTCALVDVEGRQTPFAGCGWDAQILADHARWKKDAFMAGLGGPSLGYARSLVAKTLPRGVREKPARVRVVNLGERALRVDPEGHVVPMAHGAAGQVLYEGPFRVGGASTTPELGLGFRAFDFTAQPEAEGKMGVRIYAGNTMGAVMRLPKLWRGEALAGDHRFLLTHCRFEFDRPMPYELGGDLAGERQVIEFRARPEAVRLVDFRALRAREGV